MFDLLLLAIEEYSTGALFAASMLSISQRTVFPILSIKSAKRKKRNLKRLINLKKIVRTITSYC